MSQSHNNPGKQPGLIDSLRGLLRQRPRAHPRSSETGRQIIEAEQQRSPHIWKLVVQLVPIWVLLVVVILIEPSLPLRGAKAIIDQIGRWARGEPSITQVEPVFIIQGGEVPISTALPPPNWSLEIAPVFTPEVSHWSKEIGNWSTTYRIKPNLIATLIQIESCGNPLAVSQAGAQGLFQVMPLHFAEGENAFDAPTNAARGLLYFGQMLATANGDVGLALAAYNGGPSVFTSSPSEWPEETQGYQFWGSGIYEEAEQGMTESPTLLDWLDSGGDSLCKSAREALGLAP
jgi:hypothetical protein